MTPNNHCGSIHSLCRIGRTFRSTNTDEISSLDRNLTFLLEEKATNIHTDTTKPDSQIVRQPHTYIHIRPSQPARQPVSQIVSQSVSSHSLHRPRGTWPPSYLPNQIHLAPLSLPPRPPNPFSINRRISLVLHTSILSYPILPHPTLF